MIKLRSGTLSTTSLSQLKQYQAAVDSQPDYPAQVAKATAMWKPSSKAFDEVKDTLIAICPGTRRCCYCEDALGTDVEHFKPKSLYPELTFEWTNYLLACSACNSTAKGDKFAVFDSVGGEHDITALPKAPKIKPIDGDPLLINPRYEDPLDFLRLDLTNTFYFQPRRIMSARDQRRAAYTIELLQLNIRVELVDWRKQAYKAFVGWVDTYRRYKTSSSVVLQQHVDDLKAYNHLAVWEEMKRVYKQRDARWSSLLARYDVLAEIDTLFTEFPEILKIGV